MRLIFKLKLADLVILKENPLQNFKTLYGTGTLRLNVDNLTDQMPEGAVMAGALAIGDYDVQGRRYMFSMEWKFH